MSIIISGGGGGGGGATTLSGLTDVTIAALANGQILSYNNVSGQWENQTGITGGLTYKGSFNATTGAPSIANAVQGDFYVISVAGTIYGQTWNVGDHLLINEDMGGSITNSKIDKVDNTDQVTSVNGQTGVVTGLLEAGNNLSDLSAVPTARTNLGLGTAAVENVGTGANNVVQLDASSRLPAVDGSQLTNLPAAPVTSVNGQTGVVTGLLEASNNLSDVANAGTSRTNLGLGTAAVENVGTGANNVVQLDGSSRLPAVDGSQLTNVLHDVVDDTTPQLGGDLDVQARIVTTSTVNGSVGIEPDGTGTVVARGTGAGNTPGTVTLNCEQNTHGVALQSPPHASAASYTLKLPTGVGTSGQALTTDGNNPAQLSWATAGASRPTVTTDSSGTDSTISNPAASVLEDIYLVDNGASAVNITLPTVTSNSGYKVQVKRLGTANVTVTPASGTLDGAANQVLSVQYAAFTCCTDGTNWFII